MHRRFLGLIGCVAVAACSGTSSGSGSKEDAASDAADAVDSSDSTGATDSDDSADAADSTDSTDSADSADATDSSDGGLYADPIDAPACQISKPLGAICNPYPTCQSGCPEGYQCAVATSETGQAMRCIRFGTVAVGGACDGLTGPYCKDASCLDGQCRHSCIDDSLCEKFGSSCKPLPTLPGKPSFCGKAQAKCDPTAGATGCEGGTACVLLDDGTSDCRAVGAAAQGEACEEPEDCSAGLSCHDGDLGLTCGQVAHFVVENNEVKTTPACPENSQPKIVTDDLAVCVSLAPLVPCDIFTQDCEDLTKGCYPHINKDFVFLGTFCDPAGAAAPGGGCEYINECVKSTFCIGDGSGAANCLRACDPDDAENKLCQTGAAATCEELGVGIGYCVE